LYEEFAAYLKQLQIELHIADSNEADE
jgi:hypothetical protein